MIKKKILEKIVAWNWDFMDAEILATLIQALFLLIFCFLVYWITKEVVLRFVHRIAKKTQTQWDDRLMEAHFFRRVILLIPLIILRFSARAILRDYDGVIGFVEIGFEVLIAIASARIIIAFINAVQAILEDTESLKDKPLKSYTQLLKIILFVFFGIIIFSILTGRSPVFFLTAMGAMSAIVLFIFKDTILGFVGSIQLAANDMVRIGDWISMGKYGADGNVTEINLASIKVRNWDLTITTIPTYALISDSFKNWRGMEESAGRRIKRAINIRVGSIRFADQEDLNNFKKIKLISEYIQEKQEELGEYNQKHDVDDEDKLNARSLTNVGVFRKYVDLYLHQHPQINTELTCMVRHLEPSEHGLPIEIYAFSSDKRWTFYEDIIADIFDHMLAIIPKFGLEVHQSPGSSDFKKLLSS